MKLDIAEAHLRKVHNLPAAFEFYSWACFPKCAKKVIYVEFKGCIVSSVYKSGPRKGRPNYRAGTDHQTLHLSETEYEQVEAAYVRDTGNCPSCIGKGKEIASSSVRDGVTYRDCRKCKGSGKAVSECV